MSLSAIKRLLVFAWQSFWRNIWLSVATITIIILAFFSINFLIVVNLVSDAAISVIQNKVDVSLYFKQDVTESQVLEAQTYLSSLTQVREVAYISQAEALQSFQQRHQDKDVIIESLEELGINPIGATLQVRAKSIDEFSEVIDIINNSKYSSLIETINYEDHKLFIDKIKSISANVKRVGFFVSMVFILIASLIVFNTIRMAIYTHRQEIAIMKLVGATNWFIRSPFLLEAVMYGVVACIVAIILIYPLLNVIQPYIDNFFLTNDFSVKSHFNRNFWQIFGLEIMAIIALNIISSSIAIRRYLKV